MASDGDPVKIPATSLVHGSQAPTTVVIRNAAAQAAGKPVHDAASGKPVHQGSAPALVAFLNKYLNESGRPDQFRADPTSDAKFQEVNPATGAVIAEYSVAEFPALARSVGVTRGLVDGRA